MLEVLPLSQAGRAGTFHAHRLQHLGVLPGLKVLEFNTQFPPLHAHQTFHLHNLWDGALTPSHGSLSSLPGICLHPGTFYFLALFAVHLNPSWKFSLKKIPRPGPHPRLGKAECPNVCIDTHTQHTPF